LGEMGCVSMYASNVMKALYKKLSCAIQNGHGITFSSSWHRLSFGQKIFQTLKETLLWRVFHIGTHTILGIFLTKRPITRSILWVSGSMASH
jgi:hypothetical protein